MNMLSLHTNTINILIIDDDEDDFIIIKEYIKNISGRNKFVIQWCGGYQEGVEAVCTGEHDIYFVDFRLGPKTGLDLIKEVVSKNCDQPLILLTGAGNQEIDLEAMQAGAADYLVKSDLNTEKLERCIRYAVARHEFVNALKANEQKFRGIFEKTKDFIFIAGEKGLFKEVNPVGESLFGYSREEMFGMHLYNLLADTNEALAIKETLLQKGEIKDRELTLLAKNNQPINSILSVSYEKDASGIFYIQGIIHDITGMKNVEKAKLQTAKLKAAERLVRILAHEVRNPLNNIILAVEQLDPAKFKEEKVYTDIIQRNSSRIDKLITELLNSSRPATISLEKATLQSILAKSIAAAMDRIILKKIDLRQDYSPNEAWIMADPDKLSIAFLNIIINGVEAARPDASSLLVQLKEDRDNYVVSITDNGHGISDENLNRLFEPYFTSKTGGMGLGLSTALSIFESHKALVEVKSALGNGTSFNLIFKK